MSLFHSCSNCGRLIWTGKEECRCRRHEYRLKSWSADDDWQSFHSRLDGESLAAEIVEHDWQQDPCDPRHVDETVILRDERGCTAEFHVRAEATVDFIAKEVSS